MQDNENNAGLRPGEGCQGHSIRRHMSAYDGCPPMLRRAMAECWFDWCPVCVQELFLRYYAITSSTRDAVLATLRWIEENELEKAAAALEIPAAKLAA